MAIISTASVLWPTMAVSRVLASRNYSSVAAVGNSQSVGLDAAADNDVDHRTSIGFGPVCRTVEGRDEIARLDVRVR